VSVVLEPIGHVRGGRTQPIDDDWGAVRSRIELDPARFGEAVLFDRVGEGETHYGARRPRGRADWPLVGSFAQRGKNRPNRLGLGVCRVVSVSGLAVEVEGLDAIDGTPVLDLKPVMKGFQPRGEIREPAWAEEIMRAYW
jgi:tRNA (Thr-GGU) A37 N-methylase